MSAPGSSVSAQPQQRERKRDGGGDDHEQRRDDEQAELLMRAGPPDEAAADLRTFLGYTWVLGSQISIIRTQCCVELRVTKCFRPSFIESLNCPILITQDVILSPGVMNFLPMGFHAPTEFQAMARIT
jgi:hypothetical protein